MFIICPKCSAKYKIPEGIQLESGQKLKCSACDFVFLKGEEAPLSLDEPVISGESSASTEPTIETFSEPLHPASELKATPADSLPDAFKPVDAPAQKSKKGIGIILLYFILVMALCALGWMYRDSLKPSMQTAFPSLVLDENKIPPKARQNALPVRPQKVEPVNQPAVQVTDLPQADKMNKIPQRVAPKQNVQPQRVKTDMNSKTLPKSARPNLPPQRPTYPNKNIPPKTGTAPKTGVNSLPTPTDKTIAPKPVIETQVPTPSKPNLEPKKIIPVQQPVEPEIVLPEPALNSEPIPVFPEPVMIPEQEVVPLFEIMETPLPAGTAGELSVNTISFRVEPTEEGVDQVLIEGQIQNMTANKKSVPVLTLLAVNKEGQILARKKVHTAGDDLEAGAQLPFYTSIMPAPAELDHIEVEF